MGSQNFGKSDYVTLHAWPANEHYRSSPTDTATCNHRPSARAERNVLAANMRVGGHATCDIVGYAATPLKEVANRLLLLRRLLCLRRPVRKSKLLSSKLSPSRRASIGLLRILQPSGLQTQRELVKLEKNNDVTCQHGNTPILTTLLLSISTGCSEK